METLPLLLAIAAIYFLFKGPLKKRPLGTITGKAYVTDGDGIRVCGHNIRLTGLDAPEWDQWANDKNGWFNHGKHVKGALIQAIGGKHVRVTVEGYDKYGRVLGSVTCGGKDVGAWLVRNGYAISAYGDKYKHLEREARKDQRGFWGLAEAYDPRAWRHRTAQRQAQSSSKGVSARLPSLWSWVRSSRRRGRRRSAAFRIIPW